MPAETWWDNHNSHLHSVGGVTTGEDKFSMFKLDKEQNRINEEKFCSIAQ